MLFHFADFGFDFAEPLEIIRPPRRPALQVAKRSPCVAPRAKTAEAELRVKEDEKMAIIFLRTR